MQTNQKEKNAKRCTTILSKITDKTDGKNRPVLSCRPEYELSEFSCVPFFSFFCNDDNVEGMQIFPTQRNKQPVHMKQDMISDI